VAPIALAFGLFLGILGAAFYHFTGTESWTPLIPAFFGLVLILLGFLALKANWRMHAMHLAALVGLIGFAVPTYRVVRRFVIGGEIRWTVVSEEMLMAALCGAFLVMCVKSFIDARRRRRQQG
jgi:hypothetical protein